MGATVYSTPEELPEPEFSDFKNSGGGYDVQAYFDACTEHEEQVSAWAREHSSSDLAGEVIRYPVADGKASYVVYTTKPLALIHLNGGDGYAINEMMLRGMRVADVREAVRQQRAIADLFGRSNRR
ncbi:MAG TPA: hypothetical protein VLA89_02850 [Gemmatimonadales bacterium]|nr:hypothetical protein [Gemmatimonadales bacterium]